MYEDREGDFSYSVRKHRFHSGKASWIWQVHHAPSGSFVEGGTSLRSHDHAKSAACNSIFSAELKAWPVLSRVAA
jgi:hypothetical protein